MSTARAQVNPKLGAYFGVFASLFVALFVSALISAQLGLNDRILQFACLILPFVLYAALGTASFATNPSDYLASGRRVPAVYNGVVIAMTGLGGVFVVAVTGLFYAHGFDAWAYVIGGVAGFVVMGILFAPYVRKFGAYTLPSFVGRRLQSRSVRVIAAAVFIVPTFLVLVAELHLAIWLARQLTGSNERWMLAALLLTAGIPLIAGGMRAATWSGTAQSIATALAVFLGIGVMGLWFTYLPLPQLSHGPILREVGEIEAAYAIPSVARGGLDMRVAGHDLAALTSRMAQPFTAMSPAAFGLVILTFLGGFAAAPWMVPRGVVTPSVHAARKSLSWAVIVFGLIMVTTAAGAVFLRSVVLNDVVGQSVSTLPAWFTALLGRDLAGVSSNLPTLPPSAISLHRDMVAVALPLATSLPEILTSLAFAGALAVALVAISGTAFGLGAMLSEDVIGGARWEPPSNLVRLMLARAATLGALMLGAFGAMLTTTDPLMLVTWAMIFVASTAFPVMLLCVWYKRLTPPAANIMMISGFFAALLMIFATEFILTGVPNVLGTAVGLSVALLSGLVVTQLTGRPSRAALEHVRDMRIPGGETIYDREMRLQRLKQDQ